MFDLLRRFRRHRRLAADAAREAAALRREHGEKAVAAARLKLKDPNLTRWGRRIMERAIVRLERERR
ncbi:hypothetical protein ACO2Q0_21365 [Phenylobacterium sp. VNQ135]|uniref:hypothetical protein n=1 Tax=Phenylobacterium sp. VNQ135 TaxID=3400922 RepID=UPI003BFCDAAF